MSSLSHSHSNDCATNDSCPLLAIEDLSGLFPLKQYTSPSPTPPTPAQDAEPLCDSGLTPKECKRRKVCQACIPCRKAHMSCDDVRPCARCVKRNQAHLCTDAPKKSDLVSNAGTAASSRCVTCPVNIRPAPPKEQRILPSLVPLLPTKPSRAVVVAGQNGPVVISTANFSTLSKSSAGRSKRALNAASPALSIASPILKKLTPTPSVRSAEPSVPPLPQHLPSSTSSVSALDAFAIAPQPNQPNPTESFLDVFDPSAFALPPLPDANYPHNFMDPDLLQKTLESLSAALLPPPPPITTSTSTPLFNDFSTSWSTPTTTASLPPSQCLAQLYPDFALATASLFGTPILPDTPSTSLATGLDLTSLTDLWRAAVTAPSDPVKPHQPPNPTQTSRPTPPKHPHTTTCPGSSDPSARCDTCPYTHLEQSLLTAAGDTIPTSLPLSTRLDTILTSKRAAGLLPPQPTQPPPLPASLTALSRQRIQIALASLPTPSPALLDRHALEHDHAFAAMGIPAALWDPSGARILRANQPLANLVWSSTDALRAMHLHDLLDEESLVAYFEKMAEVAGNPAQKAVIMAVGLKKARWRRKRRRSETGFDPTSGVFMIWQEEEEEEEGEEEEEEGMVRCTCSLTVRRDTEGKPVCVVGHFLPVIAPSLEEQRRGAIVVRVEGAGGSGR
ncbi:hypothetical protein BJ742DRAFT_841341 [Cladochytrium replicatum]|nr:hypothetical protein BJ742DRAFT_841341 [Cladochytrium replicatum]